jgi:hypothetical protein
VKKLWAATRRALKEQKVKDLELENHRLTELRRSIKIEQKRVLAERDELIKELAEEKA